MKADKNLKISWGAFLIWVQCYKLTEKEYKEKKKGHIISGKKLKAAINQNKHGDGNTVVCMSSSNLASQPARLSKP